MFREGTYLVKDTTTGTGYLVSIKGTAPYLKLISAINFSKFQETGEIVSYKPNSPILKAMEKNPNTFEFNTLAIEMKSFFSNVTEEEPNLKVTDNDEMSKFAEYYINCKCDEGKLIAHIAVNNGTSVANATEIAKNVIRKVKQKTLC